MKHDINTGEAICEKCGKALTFAGFERNLITRGKEKGTYTVEKFYRRCNCGKNNIPYD